MITLNDIQIRTELKPGDIGYITWMHGTLYNREYGYGVSFESYVSAGLSEFYFSPEPARRCIWICEHNKHIVGTLALMPRGDEAQLRFFLILPEYRGIGLGKVLMQKFIDFAREKNFRSSYLWTTDELDTAANLYTRFGFCADESKSSTAFGKDVKEVKYTMRLGEL